MRHPPILLENEAPNLPLEGEGAKDDEVNPWHHFCKKVTPLAPHHSNRVHPEPTRHHAAAPQRRSSQLTESPPSHPKHIFTWDSSPPRAATSALSDASVRWSRHPVGRAQWRRWLSQHPDHWIDLHGDTLDSAFHALARCLHEAQCRGYRVILCIHGKGIRSPQGESVLRRALREWLAHCPDVIAYSAAPDHRGGDGATFIWLRAPSRRKR